MSYEKPNYTQIPNTLLDDHLPLMNEAELKVTIVIARKTFGWHKDEDRISLSQLEEATGLSRSSVIDGVEAGLARKTIRREVDGQGFRYSLLVANCYQQDANQREIATSTSSNLLPKLVANCYTQKKGKKDKENSLRAQKSIALDDQPSPTLFPLETKTKPSKTSKTKKEDNPEEKERKARSNAILNAYVEVRGKNGINYSIEGTFAKKIDKDGYSSLQVKGCYLWLKSKPFWEDQPVTLSVIFKNMPEYVNWLEKNLPEATNGAKKEAVVLDVNWGDI